MNQQSAKSFANRMPLALTGIVFGALYFIADFVRSALTTAALPLPDAPVEEAARYFDGSKAAALAVGACQILSALALFVFAGCVVRMTWRMQGEGGALSGATRVGGILAGTLLVVCGILGMVLVPAAATGNLGLVGTLRTLNFLTGGTLHVAALGVFIGAASLIARRTKALPTWLCWLGYVIAVVALLSLTSLFVYYANAFILLGRLLSIVWCAATGIALALGKRQPRAATAGEDRHVLA